MKHLLRYIPPIHELQRDERFTLLMERKGIDSIHMTNLIKQVIEIVRAELMNGEWTGPEPGNKAFIDFLFRYFECSVNKRYSYTLKRVVNATGTILHTNLGRARMSERAARHMLETALHYSNLEYKLEEGERGSRHSHVEALLTELTGAEAAMVVNNNAAAVYLILKSLAEDREVIVSRGQLVEIGGSFRISSIMEESGAHLVEVGTTNKTHLADYEKAISEQTAMILKVHTSNFKVIGFTQTVDTTELASLANDRNVIFYEDLGSGALYDYQRHGIGDEPVVKDVLKMGTDLVSFSGDKLLGGPQAGIIAGKKELIDRLKKHQLARVLRVDKMTLAALEGTLLDYLKGDIGIKNIPVIRDLLMTKEELKERTETFLSKLADHTDKYKTTLRESLGQVGGGTMPDVELPSYVAVIIHKYLPAFQVAKKLRTEFTPGIVVRIQKEEVLIDLRTVTMEEETHVLKSLSTL
ncbi:L-seryl-tRNA(Sec) selenium transferase [Bacillus sp. FJAT-29790]|uniref:L-seryl-tRNA(Sec) selenium transferase n=1 Tax=Bacillus sp. FJAT-29790 TaxID=1895002 RepID=UPI001C2187C7|nr:L-seryl-tRNA(Sec) selenium transferase [Bacillus sp. FJAT-29790]MBU8878326.1 L-seryl-tRNA(Sec) selenium transferase [Bacillus sp. FJAT-29790]